MSERWDIPGHIAELTDLLSLMEQQLLENPGKCASGERIVREKAGHLETRQDVSQLNVIPGGVPGQCRSSLLVVIGSGDGVDRRVLQAIEHLSARCRGVTTSVVFWAAKWDSVVWAKHSGSFKA